MVGSTFPIELQPQLPEELEQLRTMANDLAYSWDLRILALFHRIDRQLWERCGHNPRMFLRHVSQQRLLDVINDRGYMEEYQRAVSGYASYLHQRARPELAGSFGASHDLIAYFCLEFGFHESFPNYSGGLGILAGDHCKAASDLGLPFIAVGLLYQMGYFTQQIDASGVQIAHSTHFYPHDLPVVPTLVEDGRQLKLSIELPGRSLYFQVWTAAAGHIKLYLLDTNLPENSQADRLITHQLYGGDRRCRLEQELLLGLGGVRALHALGLQPTVWHINEGHSAFQLLERCHNRMGQGLDFDSAMELVAAGTVFTTHTPVPAGHDIFPRELINDYLELIAARLEVDSDRLYGLGLNSHGGFNMTALALRCSRFHNGVSEVHGGVASKVESSIWPEIPPAENPVTHVTNGVHLQTFMAREWINLLNLHFDNWKNELCNEDYWERLEAIPDYNYWSIHLALKQQLLAFLRERLVRQHHRLGTSDSTLERITRHLDGDGRDTLVMGFARRFATYKRAGMLFIEPERLARLLNNPEQPGIIIFAGKAHPDDLPGQAVIRRVHEYSMHPDLIGRVILLEGYDLAVARRLVSGVDVWLNTPEYPLEASGTSGQKAAMNGAVNVSVLDGWWAEGYNGQNGWGITPQAHYADAEERFEAEGRELLALLEQEVFPSYRHRDGGGYSPEWVALSKASMKSIVPRFNAERMVVDYVQNLYLPARAQRLALEAEDCARARALAAWKHKVRLAWPGVSMQLMLQPPARLLQDEAWLMQVQVNLNGLEPGDLVVECLVGEHLPDREFSVETAVALTPGASEGRQATFELAWESRLSGLKHYQVRMYPWHPDLSHRFELGCMRWV